MTNVLPSNTGLLVVDMQNDFFKGGALPVPGAEDIIEPVNRWLQRFNWSHAPIFMSFDWHPPITTHFDTYPPHCLSGSKGSEYHPEVDRVSSSVIYKGYAEDSDGLSAMYGKMHSWGDVYEEAHEVIHRYSTINQLIIVGLAYDICVAETALDAVKCGFNVTVDSDACASVDPNRDATTKRLIEGGVNVLQNGTYVGRYGLIQNVDTSSRRNVY